MRNKPWRWGVHFFSLAIGLAVLAAGTSCKLGTSPERVLCSAAALEQSVFSFLRTEGTRTVDESGQPVVLKGCNLGNWLLLEIWMMDTKEVRDQYEFESVLEERFGRERKDRLMEIFRENWITERDFEIVRSFGFNAVRLPFDYTLLEDDAHPFTLKKDAFKWLDTAVAWAEKNGLYVILDMHGVPGRQSTDHCTGRVDYNRFWDDKACQDRTVYLWTEIARHYKDSPVVAAYEPINEPFGDYKTERHLPILIGVMDELFKAIRSVDPRHIVVIPGVRQGITFYGNPHERGWENALLTEHYYVGVHSEAPELETHRWMINRQMAWLQSYLDGIRMPFLLGEFNVVFRKAGGPLMMRHYYDLFQERGWWATMWCYKLVQNYDGVGKDNWYMVKNARKHAAVSIRNSSEEDIEAWFRWFGSTEYAVFEDLRSALTNSGTERLELEETPPLTKAPFNDPSSDWQATDIDARPEGGQKGYSPSKMDVYGGGRDIWSDHDEFRFVWRKAGPAFTMTAVITNLDRVNPFTKAGIMVRGGLEADAPHVLLHVFPNGQALLGWRSVRGAMMQEKRFPIGEGFPIRLQLKREGNRITAVCGAVDGSWSRSDSLEADALGDSCQVGLAVLSHDDRFLASASFENIQLQVEE